MDIIISGLEKSFGQRRVLRGFDAVFSKGELSCIMGRSGCGKTTLLNILLGIIPYDDGDIKGMPGKISCVFQEDRLCEDFTAVTNVRIVCGKNVNKANIETQLAEVGLGDSLYRPIKELSGGMKRRVSIVRALMAEGELIIMDEPFKGLDDSTKLLVAGYVKRQIRGRTAIMVTHDESEVELMGGSLIHMPLPPDISSDENE
ncbi:MAG: ATP-binding cassette domain-containing protein [Clostridiales bacterium]|nr:ATP-binding cassette domain-containing protein [Clostridiales bacterium]